MQTRNDDHPLSQPEGAAAGQQRPFGGFDAVCHGYFKSNRRRQVDYPNRWAYTRELYQVPGVYETVNVDHIKRHYYGGDRGISLTRILPQGPGLDFWAPHGSGDAGVQLCA